MSTQTVWQVAVSYRDGHRWKRYKTAHAYTSKRTALDRATDMQHRPSPVMPVPERWYIVPTILTTE